MSDFGATASPAVQKLLDGGTYKEVAGLVESDLEAIYAMAFGEFEQGKYEAAERTFGVLSFFDHKDERFWLGLGAARQRQKKLAEAVMAFSMAAESGSTNPLVPLSAAECYLGLGMPVEAVDAMEAALGWAGNADNPQRIVTRVAALLEAIESNTAQSNDAAG